MGSLPTSDAPQHLVGLASAGDKDGPLQTLAIGFNTALQLHQISRSCIVQHFVGLIVGQRKRKRVERSLQLTPCTA